MVWSSSLFHTHFRLNKKIKFVFLNITSYYLLIIPYKIKIQFSQQSYVITLQSTENETRNHIFQKTIKKSN